VPLQSPAATPVALAAGPSLPSVAVLPFVNLSGDKDQEYFCDGIAEELINALGTVGGLRVTSFTSSLRFKARAVDIREIGAHLRVGTVLEGTLRKAGSRVRLTAQLVDAADGYQLWSDRYDRELDDVFALQDEIARGIVERLKVRLLGDRAAPIVRPATPNVEAHDLYLQGRHHFGRRYKGAVGRAVECFEKALALDPRFAAACAGLADCYAVMALWGDRPAGELRGLARGIIERARSLDASLAEVHHAIGMVRLYLDWDWPALESAFEEALRINPGLAYTRACFAAGLTVAGDRARAEAQAEQALALDPLSPLVITLAAGAWGGFGSHDRAVRLLERALELDAEFTPALVNLAQTLSAMGRDADAMAAASRAVGIAGRRPHFLSVLGAVLASAGQTDESRAILSEIEDIARSEYVSPMESITVLAALGDADRVFEALDRAAGDRLPPYPFLFLLPAYDRLRRDPRFAPVLARFNYHGTWLTEAGATRTGFRR
jgi:adenylate cyclase